MANLTVANTIRAQLGNMACAMLGAKDFVGGEDFLQFRIQGSPKKVNKLVIRLAADDTYTIEAWNIRGLNMKKIAELEGVYVDAMHRTIESMTGLYTKL